MRVETYIGPCAGRAPADATLKVGWRPAALPTADLAWPCLDVGPTTDRPKWMLGGQLFEKTRPIAIGHVPTDSPLPHSRLPLSLPLFAGR